MAGGLHRGSTSVCTHPLVRHLLIYLVDLGHRGSNALAFLNQRNLGMIACEDVQVRRMIPETRLIGLPLLGCSASGAWSVQNKFSSCPGRYATQFNMDIRPVSTCHVPLWRPMKTGAVGRVVVEVCYPISCSQFLQGPSL